MDFGLLPPETNSARIYTGPGSAPMLTAAAGWDSLAADLSATGEAFHSVVLSLTSLHWRGPASLAMQTAAVNYTRWLHTTAEQARQTAAQARAAAAVYEQARAMTVPPPAVAANRSQLSLLLATNFLGQNTAAIAATEAEYIEMWAQDAAAMYAYAAGSAAATQLAPFVLLEHQINPAGLAAQSAAVVKALSPRGSAIQSLLSGLGSGLSRVAESASGLLSELPIGEIDAVETIWTTFSGVQTCQSLVTSVIQAGRATATSAIASAAPAQNLLPALVPAVNTLSGGAGRGVAILGGANRIGPLAVPPSWAAQSVAPIAALPGTGLSALPGTGGIVEAGSGVPAVPFLSSPTSRAFGVAPRYGTHLTVMARPPAAG